VSNLLAEAVAELHLEPGQTYRTTVNDIEVQLHRAAVAPVPSIRPTEQEERRTANPPEDEPSQFADMVMLEPWVDLGAVPSPNRITVKAKFGQLPFPDPPIIPPDDEVEE